MSAPANESCLEYVQRSLGYIRDMAAAGDHERAHELEDALRTEFIEWIRDGVCDGDPAALAQLVLSSDAIEFRRWRP